MRILSCLPNLLSPKPIGTVNYPCRVRRPVERCPLRWQRREGLKWRGKMRHSLIGSTIWPPSNGQHCRQQQPKESQFLVNKFTVNLKIIDILLLLFLSVSVPSAENKAFGKTLANTQAFHCTHLFQHILCVCVCVFSITASRRLAAPEPLQLDWVTAKNA